MKIKMQKSFLPSFLALFLIIAGCSKNDVKCPYTDPVITVPASELTALEAYLSGKGITNAVKDSRGFYYTIENPGAGLTPELCSDISIYYIGKLTNDIVFDQTNGSTRTFTLGRLIPGWIKGIPLVKTGGKILLYLPPSLGYGDKSNGTIPANSILIFDVELVGVQ